MSTVQTIRVRRRSWDAAAGHVEVTLRPEHGERWDVYFDGAKIGWVERYIGTLDRDLFRGSRIRVPGKHRTLWSFGGIGHGRQYDQTSRADCIRSLLRDHGVDL